MKKGLGIDRDGIQLTMRKPEMWSFATGIIAYNTIFYITSKLTYFYTDKVGFAAGLAGTALLASKIADAFTDLIMGHIVDRTHTKWGKARPWMLWMAIPTILVVVLLLLVPKDFSETGKFVYIVITNILVTAIVLTAIQVPYNCLFFYRTRSQIERVGMNIRRVMVGFGLSIILNMGFIPLTNWLGGDQAAWVKAGFVIAVVAALGLFICFKGTKEVYSDIEKKLENDVPFIVGVKTVFKNKYWVIMALAQLLAEAHAGIISANNIYYVRWVFGDERLVGVMSMIGLLPTLIGFFIISPLVKKFGPLNISKYSILLGVAAAFCRALFPRSFMAVSLFGGISGLAVIPYTMTDNVLINNVADFEEWRSGKKIAGLINSAISFGKKVGGGLGAGMVGWILAFCGYQAASETQPESVIRSILVMGNWLPIIMMLLLFLLLNSYDLEKKYPNFRKELIVRNTE
jgi:GPH family glycoside/pentoside/hexuronide:cation symporter